MNRSLIWKTPFAVATWLGMAALACAADLTLTLGSSGSALKPLLSINAGPTPPTNSGALDQTAIYQRLGVKMVRTHDFNGPFDMVYMYPDRSLDPTQQSAFNFTSPAGKSPLSSDDVYKAITAGGFGVYLRIGDSAGDAKTPSDSERANWAKAAVQVLKHYAKGQWSGFNGDIQYVEIGNEPDSSGFWTGTATQFYQLYVETAKALRAEFPTLKIGGPGITQGGYSTTLGKQWVSNFLDYVKSNGAPLDFFSWHIYSNSADDFATAAAYYRTTLDGKGYTATESHLTEWNSGGSTTNTTTNSDYRAKAKGAAVITAGWIGLQEQGVNQAFFYRGADIGTPDPQLYGLIFPDGTPKKSALAYSLWNEVLGYATRYPLTFSETLVATGVKALAAQRSDGALAILVANTGTSSVKWTLAFPDSRKLASYPLTLKTLDDSDTLLKVNTPSATEFDLAAGTAQLLLVHAGSDSFAATPVAFGKLANHYLALDLQAAAADVGQTRKVYLAAQLGKNWYLHNGTTWQTWSGGSLPAYSSGALPAVLHIPMLSKTDISAATGGVVYVGYGQSDSEMASAGRYKAVYTVPAQ
ncbi:MAG: hypothetical protein KGZ83_10135 [Sulfuricella sp.]|nr:hypothetical protein [Sulfuricella sp.]